MNNFGKYFKISIFLILALGLVLLGRSLGKSKPDAGQAAVLSALAGGQASLSAFEAPLLEDELPAGLSLDAKVAFIRELDGSENLLAYHTKIFWPIASITKLMTAVVAQETLGEDAKIQITDSVLNVEGVAGNLKAGQRYTVWDLIKAMLTVSSNDAAEALAQAYEKTVLTPAEFNTALSKHAYFVDKMNAKAAELGMTDTSYGDPSGISMTNQSTAGDLYKLVVYISRHDPDFWKITRTPTNNITDLKAMRRQTLRNINTFSGQADFVGGKTGHTPESGDNLISIFNYQGRQYLLLVFGATDRFAETRKMYDWLKSSLSHE